MSQVGFWCTADGGKTYFNLNSGGVRAITFLRRIRTIPLKSKTISVDITEKDPAGTLFVVPVVASLAHWVANANTVSFISTNSISINGSVVTIEFSAQYKNQSGPVDGGDGDYYFDVYQSVDSGDGNGLYLFDGSGFSGITDSLRAGYCVYKATILMQNGWVWTMPDDIPYRDNATVFANWSSEDAVIVYNNLNKSVQVTGGDVILNVAIFSNGFPLHMPGAGFFIYSKVTGQCVYNSHYTPLFLKNTILFNGDAIDTGISKPMIPLSTIGMDGTKSGDYYQLFNRGFKMSGQTVYSGRGENTQYVYTQGFRINVPKTSFPLIICDGNQYFN